MFQILFNEQISLLLKDTIKIDDIGYQRRGKAKMHQLLDETLWRWVKYIIFLRKFIQLERLPGEST